MINHKSKIFVAGHKGLVGSAIIRKLHKEGFKNILTVNRKNLDLKGWEIIDQYNNNINFTLNVVAKNDVYEKDTFKIPDIN